MATTPEKTRRRPGRPTREEEIARALAGLGIDPALICPKRILASIAANADAPASARVNAARALLGYELRVSKRDRQAAEAKQAGNGEWGDDLKYLADGRQPP